MLESISSQLIIPRNLLAELELGIKNLEAKPENLGSFIAESKMRFLDYRHKIKMAEAWGVNLGIASFAMIFAELDFWAFSNSETSFFIFLNNTNPHRDVLIWFLIIIISLILLIISIHTKNIYLDRAITRDPSWIHFALDQIINYAPYDRVKNIALSLQRAYIARWEKEIYIYISNSIGIIMIGIASLILANIRGVVQA